MENVVHTFNTCPLRSGFGWKISSHSGWKVWSYSYSLHGSYIYKNLDFATCPILTRQYVDSPTTCPTWKRWQQGTTKIYYKWAYFEPCYMFHWPLLLVFHPGVWRPPRRAPQQTNYEAFISDSRVARIGQTENAYRRDLRAPEVTHKRIWASHEAIPWSHLFTVSNLWTTPWTCSTKSAATPACSGFVHPWSVIVISKEQNIELNDSEISFPRRLCRNNSAVWLYWLLLNATGMLCMHVILIQMPTNVFVRVN